MPGTSCRPKSVARVMNPRTHQVMGASLNSRIASFVPRECVPGLHCARSGDDDSGKGQVQAMPRGLREMPERRRVR